MILPRTLARNLPENYRKNLEKAAVLLKNEGCTDVFLFGSLVTGNIRPHSDIDIGVKGLAAEKFIPVYSKLYNEFDTPIDLVDFDFDKNMFALLSDLQEVVKIG
jgi:predicted nucleotidyltransferase